MEITLPLVFILCLLFHCEISHTQINPGNTISSGYQNGTLIVIGGGVIDDVIMKEFWKYAGGDTAKIVVIPTAMEDNELKKDSAFNFIKLYRKWKQKLSKTVISRSGTTVRRS